MIRYVEDSTGITPEQLTGFFEGWPKPPSPATHREILRRSDAIVLAVDEHRGDVVGFVTAITDGVLAAYIPLVEVLPAYRGRGIGRELVRRVVDHLGGLYMIDVVCDPDVVPFYEGMGFRGGSAAMLRRFDRQAGVVAGAPEKEPSP
ncbi:GNAT family N-acetyltransferase [bacterium]|nr:GNAT family N-acetyltransferase [bacterium]